MDKLFLTGSYRVSRLICESESYEMHLILDVNTELYPINADDRFTCAIARTLHEDGQQDEGQFNPLKRGSLADKFDYVMYGKVYKCEEDPKAATKMFAFFYRAPFVLTPLGLCMCRTADF